MPTPVFGSVVAQAAWPKEVAALAEAAALTRRELFDNLADNRFISNETWYALYTAKPLPPVERAVQLVNRPLSDEQVEWVCSVETRATVMRLILAYHEVSTVALSRLACGKGLSQVTARQLIEADWVTSTIKEQVARKAGGNALVRWLGSSDLAQCSTANGEAIISDTVLWGKSKVVSHQLMRILVDRRPDLYRSIIKVGMGHPLFRLVLGSRHLTDPKLAESATAQILNIAYQCVAVNRSAKPDDGTNLEHMRRKDAARRLLRACERFTAELIANTAVAPALAKAAYEQFTTQTRRFGRVADAYAARQQVHEGGYDPMAHAIVESYDSISDPVVLAYVVDRMVTRRGLALADLARNPHLGKHAETVAMWLGRSLYWDLTPNEADGVLAVFQANYPEQEIELAYGRSRTTSWETTPEVPKALYVTGDLSSTRWMRTNEEPPAKVMPKRYPLALSLINALSAEAYCGIAAYIAKRLGQNATAWQTFFALADELASSDLDTLCDTALTLSE